MIRRILAARAIVGGVSGPEPDHRVRNEENVSKCMPLSISGRVIACQLKCAQVYVKVAHCDSTVILNFSTTNIHIHLRGGRN